MKRRRRPKLRAPEALTAVLSRAGEDRFAKNRAPVAPHVWAAAVGARIAERTRPIGIENGVLLVRAATSVWASELTLLADTLLTRLRSAGVALTGMRFRVGPIDPPDRAVTVRRTTVPRPQPLDGRLTRAIGRIEDPELREAITEAAKTNLAWQAAREPVAAMEGAAARLPGSGDGARDVARNAAQNVTSAAPPAARAPRGAETRTGPPARRSPGANGGSRGTRGDD
jgi:hypothetical protein